MRDQIIRRMISLEKLYKTINYCQNKREYNLKKMLIFKIKIFHYSGEIKQSGRSEEEMINFEIKQIENFFSNFGDNLKYNQQAEFYNGLKAIINKIHSDYKEKIKPTEIEIKKKERIKERRDFNKKTDSKNFITEKSDKQIAYFFLSLTFGMIAMFIFLMIMF